MAKQNTLPAPSISSGNQTKLIALILPLISCSISSIIGMVIGQVGNLVYRLAGDTAICLTVPGFAGLFILTFALSFFSNRLLKKLFNQRKKGKA